MAGYTTGSSKTFAILCPLCDKFLVSKGNKSPEKCGNCGHDYNEPVTIQTFGAEKAKPATHKQYRVFCRSCNQKSIVWRSKKASGRPVCPHCGEVSKLNVSSISPSGDCITTTLWGESYGTAVRKLSPTKPKKKMIACEECGLRHHYLIKVPARCSRCGREFT